MAFEIGWHIEKRVMLTRFYGEINEVDLAEHGAKVEGYIKEGSKPLFLVANALGITKYPTNLKEALEAMGKTRPQKGDVEWTIVVTDSRFINFVGSIVSNVFQIAVRTCKSMEEAEAFIAHHAPDLVPALEARKVSETSDSMAS
jgi:hypothetical protein